MMWVEEPCLLSFPCPAAAALPPAADVPVTPDVSKAPGQISYAQASCQLARSGDANAAMPLWLRVGGADMAVLVGRQAFVNASA